METRNVYDISVVLGEESVTCPGDPVYSRKTVQSMADGDICNLSALELGTHSGTHIDLPAHFIPQGKTLEHYSAADFILPARVVDVDVETAVMPEHLEGIAMRPGDALLLRTRNSIRGLSRSGKLVHRFVHLSPAAARLCTAAGLALVGIDYISIEPLESTSHAVHRELLSAGVMILEGIHLAHVPAGRYRLICLPLKMRGAEASPVRAVLVSGLYRQNVR